MSSLLSQQVPWSGKRGPRFQQGIHPRKIKHTQFLSPRYVAGMPTGTAPCTGRESNGRISLAAMDLCKSRDVHKTLHLHNESMGLCCSQNYWPVLGYRFHYGTYYVVVLKVVLQFGELPAYF